VQQPSATLVPPAPSQPWGVPADFDTANFLRHAKSSFIRMQAAWDKADVADLREFTTPEVFAELKMQIQERGANADFTDVVSIDAELLGIETIADEYLASVKFTGLIKAAPTANAEPFAEVWNMSKPVSGSGGWVLAGIQQLS
jgi:predicted lipid-binding transport protein (Tim44 family)